MGVKVEVFDAEATSVEVVGPGEELPYGDLMTGQPAVQPPGKFTLLISGDECTAIDGTRTQLRDLLRRMKSALDDPALTDEI
ncbi:hypothetical protein HCA61_22475 [Rhodococcus sp. HNM0563]|mgnify:CR=1 FL=1|uniref:hypothetical protein n=1 Tax=Rhodococcus sp. HNM0563 TaxID=2716339 RepID=UPI00146D871A|nr:hypothetical protein [Rhodococcus sp. HNM0563]NLU65006.1 hypothetical protein [Rhodococcus sp. HNM0563]